LYFYHRDLDGISCSSGLLLFASISWDLLSSIVIFQTTQASFGRKTSYIWEQILFSGFFFKPLTISIQKYRLLRANGSRFYQFLKSFLFPLLRPKSNFKEPKLFAIQEKIQFKFILLTNGYTTRTSVILRRTSVILTRTSLILTRWGSNNFITI
jgi:hypothetical protein